MPAPFPLRALPDLRATGDLAARPDPRAAPRVLAAAVEALGDRHAAPFRRAPRRPGRRVAPALASIIGPTGERIEMPVGILAMLLDHGAAMVRLGGCPQTDEAGRLAREALAMLRGGL